MKKLILILIGIICINLVYASTCPNGVYPCNEDVQFNNPPIETTSSINQSILNVNDSTYLNGFTSDEFWQTDNNQNSLTGNKSGSYSLNSTGSLYFNLINDIFWNFTSDATTTIWNIFLGEADGSEVDVEVIDWNGVSFENLTNVTANKYLGNGSLLTGILHLNQDNFYEDGWIVYDETNKNFTFNQSKLSTIYYNATQSQLVNGIIDGGTLQKTQHPNGHYDGVTFNFSEASGSPALDLRVNFTGVPDFTQGIIRYKTSSLAGNYPLIQVWDYDSSTWEDYPPLSQTIAFSIISQPVFDKADHIQNGVVQMRIYKASNGNTQNHYYVDWLALSKGFGVPAGEEIDPYLANPQRNINNSGYNITASYFKGDGSLLTGITGGNTSWNQSYADTRYAQYQFNNNNFNGSGNFTTTGNVTVNSMFLNKGNITYNGSDNIWDFR